MKYVYYLILSLITACHAPKTAPALFENLPASHTGIDFRNDLEFDKDFNIFTYRNFYNGGGVALGDVNNDGLLDIYFTSNMGDNKLYLNQGEFKFLDVTEEAGVAGTQAWSTGVSMADLNGDGWLDIYVCNSGDISGDSKQNELFVNNGDGTFTEMAEALGLIEEGYSTHAVFFDYDNDGDLDVYLLNNSFQAIGSFNKMQHVRPIRDRLGGDKLFRNDGEKFTDVSEEAGIYGSVIGFGLGISIGDVNQDGWMDIFISNDFFEKDYLYINDKDGTFSESMEGQMRSISAASMGADIADINNNGLLDIFVTDMLPEPKDRLKQITTFEDWDRFQHNKTHGYHYQYNRNMLHVNNGDGTFSELGRQANVEATDWSWGALIFDMDNDGLKDIFVANGIYKDITDLDYLNFIGNEETMKRIMSKEGVDYKALVDPIPVTPVSNYAYKNLGDLKFANHAVKWGLGDPGHSNGAAYGDLNNDGAIDLVINNVNGEASVYKNQSLGLFPGNKFMQITLRGKDRNPQAIGAQVRIKTNRHTHYQEQMPNRGFQSSVDQKLTFGLGEVDLIEEISIRWPDGKITNEKNILPNQHLTFDWSEANTNEEETPFFPVKESPVFVAIDPGKFFTYLHSENEMVDFDRDRLTYHMLSTEGPKAATGDINGDGLEDVFIGGARGFSGQVFIQQKNGNFLLLAQEALEKDRYSEDTDAVFFDANGDGHLDLLVTSGGSEAGFAALELADRLYLNDGLGNFKKSANSGLSVFKTSSSTVKVTDFNGDGFPDLFIGTLMRPRLYGIPASSYLFLNDGKGQFKDVSNEWAPELENIGMVTDASWADLDCDGQEELIIVGHWLSPVIFTQEDGKFKKKNTLKNLKGWYRSVVAADLNGDGLPDLILGNHGKNTRFKATPINPIRLFVHDFDQNGSLEHIYTRWENSSHTVFNLKHELEKDIPSLKKRYLKYSSYNDQSLEDIFSKELLDQAVKQEVTHLETSVLINKGNFDFSETPLPPEAQKTWIYSIIVADLNKDGIPDLLLGGNISKVKPEAGKYDAGYGEIFLGKGDGSFEFWPNRQHGLQLTGDIRDLNLLKVNDERILMVVRNNGETAFWQIK